MTRHTVGPPQHVNPISSAVSSGVLALDQGKNAKIPNMRSLSAVQSGLPRLFTRRLARMHTAGFAVDRSHGYRLVPLGVPLISGSRAERDKHLAAGRDKQLRVTELLREFVPGLCWLKGSSGLI